MNIKECPFCGSTKTHVIQASIGYDWSVECMTCETIGPSQDGADVAILSWNEGSPRWKKFFEMKAALERIRDCDFVMTLPDRMDAVRAIAREALE
jgi:Lar family restriction alleviation protein